MNEMRKDRRAPSSLKVKYKSASVDEFIEQFGVDVSRGGIFIKTKKPLETGALLKFEFQLQDGSAVIFGLGRVAWRRGEGKARPDQPAGMGIKFVKLDDACRATVERIAGSHGAAPSRFELTEGAEHTPPLSSMPPPATVRAHVPTLRNSVPPPAISSVPPPARALAAPRASVAAAPRRSVAPTVASLFSEAPAAPRQTSSFPPASSFKLPKGMVGSFFGDENKPASPQAAPRARDSSEFLATAFSVGGAGHETKAEARAQAEQARREDPADLADALFGDMPSKPPVADSMRPLGDPEELAGLHRGSEPKVPSLEEVAMGERIPSMEELADAPDELPAGEADELEAPTLGAAFGGADDDDSLDDDDTLEQVPRDASLRPAAALPVPVEAPARTRGGSSTGIVIGVAALIVLAAGGYFFMLKNQAPAAPEAPIAAAPAAPEVTPPAAPAPAPTEPAPAAEPSAATQAAAAPTAAAAPGAPTPGEGPQAGSPVSVNITSSPSGAQVMIDGKVSGTTPTTPQLPSGKAVDIAVHFPAFATLHKTVTPSAGMEPQRFKLEPLSYSLVIRTDPPGATLTVKDVHVVSPAPIELGHLEGTVSVSIEKGGYQRTSRVVRLEEFSEQNDAMRADVALSLTALPPSTNATRPQGRKPAAATPHVPAGAPPVPDRPVVEVKAAAPKEPKAAPAPKPAAPAAPSSLPDNPF